MNWIRSIAVLIATGAIAAAAPTITAVQDAAGYDTEITRGAMVIVKGAGLGPDPLVKADSFPLQTTFNGVSVKIEVNGTTTDGILYYVWDAQSAFVLPSATPAGTGTLTYTYNGQSTTYPITVVDRNPQIYTLDSSGSGQAVVTFHANNFFGDGYVQNTNAINPGNIVIVWMQGLGPVNFDETIGAQQVDLSSGVQLTVGGVVPGTIYYLGRYAGDGTSVDLAVFEWPSGIQHTCSVPIQVTIDGRMSNAVTAPAAENGRTCSNGGGNNTVEDDGTFESLFSSSDFNNWLSDGNASGGVVTFNSTETTQLIGLPGQPAVELPSSSQDASGGFYRVQVNGQADIVDGVRSLVGGQVGECYTVTYEGFDVPSDLDPSQFGIQFLDAGDLMANGSFGQRTFEKLNGFGVIGYSLEFNNQELSQGGTITVTSTGSADVNAFSGSVQSPGNFQVTNLEALRSLNRSNITVNWTPVEGGVVIINGSSVTGGTFSGTHKEFTCVALASAGTFSVPANIGNHLDATDGYTGGNLSVTYSFFSRVPSNLDFVLLALEHSIEQSADYD